MRPAAAARREDETRWILELQGPLTRRCENLLLDAHETASRGGARWLGLDFGRVERMDGNGLSLLVRLLTRTSQAGQRLAAFDLTPRCRQLFRELGLDAALTLFSSAAQALGEEPARDSTPERQEICSENEWALGLGRARPEDPGNAPLSLNVAGRVVATPLQGFGELWHKVYRLRLPGAEATPDAVAGFCKENLGALWPEGNDLYVPGGVLVPGSLVHFRLRLPGGVPLFTGARVLHLGRTAFTFLTLEGHLESGWITFSTAREAGTTVMQVESLARTGDPMYEVGFRLFGHGQQEQFWRRTLTRLADHYRVAPHVEVVRTCIDGSSTGGDSAT